MSDLPITVTPFQFETQAIRSVIIDGDPWFAAGDVCRILGYANGRDAVQQHCRPKGVAIRYTLTPGGTQRVGYINEPNLYRLIIRSHLPAAEKFEAWVMEDLLPTIRKTGSYSIAPQSQADESFTHLRQRWDILGSNVPPGYWSVFHEISGFVGMMVVHGLPVNTDTIADISVGLMWGKWWRKRDLSAKHGPRVEYEHRYPDSYRQAWAGDVRAWAYPNTASGDYKTWLSDTYLGSNFPKYISRKRAQIPQWENLIALADHLRLGGPLPAALCKPR